MGKLLYLPEEFQEANNPVEFDQLKPWQKEGLLEWIDEFVRPHKVKVFNNYHSSYGLKHLFHENGGFYVTNGQFKGAMLEAGFEPEKYEAKNWVFKVGRRAGKTRNHNI